MWVSGGRFGHDPKVMSGMAVNRPELFTLQPLLPLDGPANHCL
jgi:hypothetical protein